MEALTNVLYNIPPAQKTRDRPLEVLCLGPSRSGTESLRNALLELGYDNTCHGYSIAANLSELRSLSDMMTQKFSGRLASATESELREQFDRWLGDYRAITDVPAAVFAAELLAAYPNAKVVLNRRDDVDGWEKSMLSTVVVTERNRETRLLSWFEKELFWLQRTWTQAFHTFFHNNFPRYGKQVYLEHFQKLEKELSAQGRDYLRWKAEDGWESLCKFLGKEIPDQPFPEGNTSAEFLKRSKQRHMKRLARAKRNAMLVLSSSLILGVAVFISAR